MELCEEGDDRAWFAVEYVVAYFFFSSRRRHTRCSRDWSSDVCSSDLPGFRARLSLAECKPASRTGPIREPAPRSASFLHTRFASSYRAFLEEVNCFRKLASDGRGHAKNSGRAMASSRESSLNRDRKSTRLNSSHGYISY